MITRQNSLLLKTYNVKKADKLLITQQIACSEMDPAKQQMPAHMPMLIFYTTEPVKTI